MPRPRGVAIAGFAMFLAGCVIAVAAMRSGAGSLEPWVVIAVGLFGVAAGIALGRLVRLLLTVDDQRSWERVKLVCLRFC